MRFFSLNFLLIAFLVLGLATIANAQQRFVMLEIYTDQRAEVGLQQNWIEALSKCGLDRVRAKSSRFPPAPKIEETKDGDSSSVVVIGEINGRKLKLPGKTFSMTQITELTAYFSQIRDDGAKVAMAEKMAFGLTSEQLVDVHTQLSAVIDQPTKGKNVGEVVSNLLGKQKHPVTYDNASTRALNGNDTVSEELQGLSIGTGLAAAIRPLGLVLQPHRKQGQDIELRIVSWNEADENWPVGWPIEVPISEVAPKLFDRLDLEIRGFTLAKTMNALESRVDIPFLYDHNGMARKGIDMETTKVTLVKKKAGYMSSIGKLLSQAKPQLIQEARMDENGKPFLWIKPANDHSGR